MFRIHHGASALTDPTQLPRFNPNATADPDKGVLASYIQSRDAARRLRIRNQRLGDVALGAACVGIGWMLVHIAAGAGK
jgi:hypothetical protein